MITTKSVHSPIEPEKDGLRLLVARHRGRGLPASRYDLWMANLGPSEALLKGFLKDKSTWVDFSKRYRAEMWGENTPEPDNEQILNHGQKFTLRLLQELGKRGNITLLCHCPEDEPHCHRHLLAKLLSSKL